MVNETGHSAEIFLPLGMCLTGIGLSGVHQILSITTLATTLAYTAYKFYKESKQDKK